MARDSIPSGPNFIHPEKPSAVGSRNSLARDGRDEYKESSYIVDEEVDKIINHIEAKLPPEVLEKLHVGASVKDLLHNYFNQSSQNMLNRYLTTVEDEMAKKYRDMLDREEFQNLNKYTPRGLPTLLDQIGGVDKFNSAEIEKSTIGIYGHLQEHILRETFSLETHTNSLLRQKVDVGAFIRGENSFSIAVCSIKDNFEKPDTVSDVVLAINVLDNELTYPIYHYQVLTEHLVKNVVSKQILGLVDREISKINENLVDEGQTELTQTEIVIEKIKAVEGYIESDEEKGAKAKQYEFISKEVYDALKGLGPEINKAGFDPLSVQGAIVKLVNEENLRNIGYNSAVNAITSILDYSKMAYQFIDNRKNFRELIIREYEDTNPFALPDEKYKIRLNYFDSLQLREQRTAYCQQLDELNSEIDKLWSVVEKVYSIEKSRQGFMDFNDVVNETLKKHSPDKKSWFAGNTESIIEEEEEKLWDEMSFVEPKLTEMEKLNETFSGRYRSLHKKLYTMTTKLNKIFKNNNPDERIICEQRLKFLHSKLIEFQSTFNPFHVAPGLVLSIAITTIKRKKTTMTGMSNVLNEFLAKVSTGFVDLDFVDHSKKLSHADSIEVSDRSFSSYEEDNLAGVADLT